MKIKISGSVSSEIPEQVTNVLKKCVPNMQDREIKRNIMKGQSAITCTFPANLEFYCHVPQVESNEIQTEKAAKEIMKKKTENMTLKNTFSRLLNLIFFTFIQLCNESASYFFSLLF